MSKFVKLGEEASVFFDPFTKIKLITNQVVELPEDYKASKKVVVALKNGHIQYASEEEYLAANGGAKTEEGEEGDEDEVELSSLTKNELIAHILETSEEHTEEALKALKKAELLEIAENL
jgi:hypothetical protein